MAAATTNHGVGSGGDPILLDVETRKHCSQAVLTRTPSWKVIFPEVSLSGKAFEVQEMSGKPSLG